MDRPGDALDAAPAAIDSATVYGVDVADAAAMRGLAAQIDPASVVMNNAGIGQGGNVFVGGETWHRVIDVQSTSYGPGTHLEGEAKS